SSSSGTAAARVARAARGAIGRHLADRDAREPIDLVVVAALGATEAGLGRARDRQRGLPGRAAGARAEQPRRRAVAVVERLRRAGMAACERARSRLVRLQR